MRVIDLSYHCSSVSCFKSNSIELQNLPSYFSKTGQHSPQTSKNWMKMLNTRNVNLNSTLRMKTRMRMKKKVFNSIFTFLIVREYPSPVKNKNANGNREELGRVIGKIFI